MVTIWHREKAAQFRARFDSSSLASSRIIPVSVLEDTLDQLSAWPFFESLDILTQAKDRKISQKMRERACKLGDLESEFLLSRTRRYLLGMNTESDSEKYQIRLVHSDDIEYLLEVFDKVQNCYKDRKKRGRAERFVRDIELGGTFFFVLEKDNEPVVYNKLFVSPRKGSDNLVLFYDSIENGDNTVDQLSQWREQGRTHELLYSVAFSLYALRQLELESVALADRELEQLGRLFGCKWVAAIPDAQRKVGLSANQRNKGEVIYQSRLFRVRNNTYRVIESATMRDTGDLLPAFEAEYAEVERRNFRPQMPRFRPRVEYLRTIGQALLAMRSEVDTEIVDYITNSIERLDRALDDTES